MKYFKGISIIVLMFVGALVPFAFIPTTNLNVKENLGNAQKLAPIAAYTMNTPLGIFSATQLGNYYTLYGGLGYVVENNPTSYTIQNFAINITASTYNYGIDLEALGGGIAITIKNIVIYCSGNPVPLAVTGIIVDNNANTVIQNCQIYGCYNGILINSTTGTQISTNQVYQNFNEGIVLRNAGSSTLNGNNVWGNVNGTAIDIVGSSTETITSNTASGNANGISVQQSTGVVNVLSNICDNNTFNGITASFTPDLTVGMNTAAYNGKDGISLSTIEYNDVTFNPTITVSQNNASYNGDVGIQEVNCNNAQISLNTIYYNSYAGISASYGGHSNGTINDIYHNTIDYNGQYGITMFLENSTNLYNNLIVENQGTGLRIQGCANVTSGTTTADTILLNGGNGIDIESNQTTIQNDQVNQNGLSGILCNGTLNHIITSTCASNSISGVNITGQNNTLTSSTIQYNGQIGVNCIGAYNTITLNNINKNFITGLLIGNTSNIVTLNTVGWNTLYGIEVYGTDQTFASNTILGPGFYLVPDTLTNLASHTIYATNSVNGNPVYYDISANSVTLPTPIGQAILVNCAECNILSANFWSTDIAIAIYYSANIEINHVIMTNHTVAGVLGYSSVSIEIDNSNITQAVIGISMQNVLGFNLYTSNVTYSSNTGIIFTGNNINVINSTITYSTNVGMEIVSNYATIWNNTITQPAYADAGILVTGSYIDIESNIITGSSGCGIYCGSVIYGAVGFCNIIMLGGNSIYLQNSTQIEIAQNSISTSSDSGLIIDSSQMITVQNNNFYHYGIELRGSTIQDFASQTIPNNNYRDGYLIQYLDERSGGTNFNFSQIGPSSILGQLIVVGTNNTFLNTFTIANDALGLQMYYSVGNQITGIISSASRYNVLLFNSPNNKFLSCQFNLAQNTSVGIFQSDGTNFAGCSFTNNQIAINSLGSNSLAITGSSFTTNQYAIELFGSGNSHIQTNSFYDNAKRDMNIVGGSINYFEDNNITDIIQDGLLLQNTTENFVRYNIFNGQTSGVTLIKVLGSSYTIFDQNQLVTYGKAIAVFEDAFSNNNEYSQLTINFTDGTPSASDIGLSLSGVNDDVFESTINNANVSVFLNGASLITLDTNTFNDGNILSGNRINVVGILVQNVNWANIEENTLTGYSNLTNIGINLINSNNIVITNNLIQAYYNGISAVNSQNIQVTLNTFCSIQNKDTIALNSTLTETLSSICLNNGNNNEANQQNNVNILSPILIGFLEYGVPVPIALLGFFLGRYIYLKRKNLR